MRYSEILEACWTGYQQQGMKDKGGRQVPNCVPVEEATDVFLDNAAREMMAVLFTMGAGLTYGVYLKIRNKLDRYQGYQIVSALEDKGVTMNRATYLKIKPVLDQFRQALKDNDGAEAKALAKRIEQMIVMGKLSAPDSQAADTSLADKERELQEDLKKWFKEKWVRFGPDGRIRGDCARGSSGEGKPKCLPQSKAQALGQKGRASAAAKKRREDPNPERRGAAKNVATRVKEGEVVSMNDNPATVMRLAKQWWTGNPQQYAHAQQMLNRMGWDIYEDEDDIIVEKNGQQYTLSMDDLESLNEADLDEACWKGYHKEGMKTMFGKRYPNCVKNKNESLEVYINRGECPGCGGRMVAEEQIAEKQDACYHKVKSRYKVWPSAYASGALVQCRKKGAANWGNKKK
jgi:hypothetical protein